MTTKNSKFAGMKKFALLPILAILFLLFSKKINAQSEPQPVAELAPVNTKTQDVAIPIDETTATPAEKALIQAFKETREDFELKKDTIKKRNSEDVATPTPPPPPPPSELKQVPAEFPGGSNVLRGLVSTNFNTSVLNGDEGLIKTTIYVSIDEKGNVSNVIAEGDNQKFNAEAVRALKVANEGKIWKPATEDSNPVKTVYRMPITMKFEGPAVKK